MPEGEIWIEQYVAKIVNDEEKPEALDLIKKANTSEIANDIESVDFVIEGETSKTAYYTVTYKDNSKSDKIKAPNLTVKPVTEHSAALTIEKTYIADGQITIKLDKKVKKGTKIGIIKQFSDNDAKNFCSGQEDTCSNRNCNADKTSKTWVAVESETDTITYQVDKNFLTLGQDFGVIVKEPRKFASCKRTQPHLKITDVEVRDPKKLTQVEKDAIKEAVKQANTRTDGVSKFPDGTGQWDGIPAFIEVDDQGNVKVTSPNDVDGGWDDGNFVPKTNDDGTVKVQSGKENNVTEFTKEEVLLNKAPDAPTISTNVDEGKITITPNPLDTDAKKIEVKYTDLKGNTKTETIEKGQDGKWKAPEGYKLVVDENTGVVTIKFENIKNKTDVSATVTDEGGIANNDKDAKTSDNKSEPIRVLPKKPNITVDETTGDVTITPVEKDKDRVAKKMEVTYTPIGETDPKTVTFTRDNEGKWSVEGKTDFEVSQDGKTITLKNGKITNNTNVTAKTNDADETDKLVSEEAKKRKSDR